MDHTGPVRQGPPLGATCLRTASSWFWRAGPRGPTLEPAGLRRRRGRPPRACSSPAATVTFSVAVSSGLIGPTDCRSRGPSIVRVWEAPDWLLTSSVIGPAPNFAGEARDHARRRVHGDVDRHRRALPCCGCRCHSPQAARRRRHASDRASRPRRPACAPSTMSLPHFLFLSSRARTLSDRVLRLSTAAWTCA